MNAQILYTPGPDAQLTLGNIACPTADPGEVVVKVGAIGINPVDVKVCQSDAVCSMICGRDRPVIPGWDIAGTVVQLGADVTGFALGDRVFGMVGFPGLANGYAERVCASASHLSPVPNGISFEDAAATTLAALTALQVLRGRVKPNDRVLIHAGSGGVGHFAIQLAKSMGAYVITTCSARNRDLVLELGADQHIDYRTTAFHEVLTDIDLVIDALGGETTAGSVKVTRDGGQVVSLPSPAFEPEVVAAAAARNITLDFVMVQSNGDDMRQLAARLSEGSLRAHVSKVFPFAEINAAHAAVGSGRTVGKVVVRVLP